MLLVPKNGPVFNRVDDASILILIGLQDSLNNSAVKLLLVAPPPRQGQCFGNSRPFLHLTLIMNYPKHKAKST